MKKGKSLAEFATEVEKRENSKADFLAPVPLIDVRSNGHTELVLREVKDDGGDEAFTVNSNAHQQLASYLDIPKPFYDSLRGQTQTLRDPYDPERPLFDAVVQGLLRSRPQDETRLIRTLYGEARGVLSDRYRPIDHYEIMARLLPVLHDLPVGWEQSSLEITDSRMYMQIVDASTPKVIPGTHKFVDDVFHRGAIIMNSEVGLGSFSVQPILYRVRCLNGLVVTEYSKRKYHTGGTGSTGDPGEVWQFMSNDTLKLRNEATIAEMRDLVKAAMLNDDFFDKLAATIQDAASVVIKPNLAESTIKNVTTRFRLTNDERDGVMGHFIDGGDLSLWGVINAITRQAQDVESYDRSVELEALGGNLLALPKAEVKALLEPERKN